MTKQATDTERFPHHVREVGSRGWAATPRESVVMGSRGWRGLGVMSRMLCKKFVNAVEISHSKVGGGK